MIYTVGHSTHTLEKFISILDIHGIEAIADVRSAPYSKFNSQYNREKLKNALSVRGIKYVFLGKELGARSEDPCCYKHGKVDYELVANTELFKSGINRVIRGANKMRLAMMCAEAEPLDCHRTILISKRLVEHGVEVRHILKNERLERHEETLKRLIGQYISQSSDLFLSEDEIKTNAYKKRGDEIAYIEDMAS